MATTFKKEIDLKKKITFNGINGRSGSYLFEPLSSEELANVAMGKTLAKEKAGIDREHVAELKFRANTEAEFSVKEGIDASKLEEAGWGVIFPGVVAGSPEAAEQDAIREALSPLLDLRKMQATKNKEHYYKEYRGALGYRPGETKQKYLARLGTGPGPADPEKVPYYLLIVGSPQVIPFHVQYQIDVQYAVGRIHFDTIEEYNNYARSVVAAETGGLVLARDIAFVGVANPDDMATQLSRKNLVGPLADMAESWEDVPGWNIRRYFDDQACKSQVTELFGGPKTPALMFSGSHGLGFDMGDPLQHRHQGALLLQDWTGPKQWTGPIDERLYLSCDDLRSDASVLGMIAFNFACYGGGTPQYDEFAKQAFKDRLAIADEAFISGLHRKLLSHPKGGALAAIGHVERAWGYSFMWGTGKRGAAEPQLAVFESTLKSLMKGNTVGMAVEYFNERYAEMASDLSQQIETLEWEPESIDPYALAAMWTSNNDARGYAIAGDPAVRLPLDPKPGSEPRAREVIDITSVSAVGATGAGAGSTAAATGGGDAAEEADEGEAPVETASVEFAWFGRGKDETAAGDGGGDGGGGGGAGGEDKPGVIEGFVSKIVGTLGRAVEDAMTLEVHTYVSSNPGLAASADKATLSRDGDLRAYTRMAIDGDTVVIIPERDGVIDKELWQMHLEMVAQAQKARAEMVGTVLSALSGLTKLR